MSDRRNGNRHSEVLDVRLLDVLAEIESLLRQGRLVQREALRVRGLPTPVSDAGRQQAGAKIQRLVAEMRNDCRSLGHVLTDLQHAADALSRELENEQSGRKRGGKEQRHNPISIAADESPKRGERDVIESAETPIHSAKNPKRSQRRLRR